MEFQEILTRFPLLVNAVEKIQGQSKMNNGKYRDTGITGHKKQNEYNQNKERTTEKNGTPERKYGKPERKNGIPERKNGKPERKKGTPERKKGTPERKKGKPVRKNGTPEIKN